MNTHEQKKPSASDRLAAFIGTAIVQIQRKIAARLSRWECRYSAGQKKALLALFCLLSAAYLVSVLVFAFCAPSAYNAETMGPTLVVPQLSLPPPAVLDTVRTIIFPNHSKTE